MTGQPPPALTLDGLAVGYPGRRRTVVLSGIDAVLVPGSLTALVGPNGAGKSTLLRTLARLQPPLAGTVALRGEGVRRLPRAAFARRVAVVLTDRVGVEHLRVADLVGLGRHPHLPATRSMRPVDHAVVERCLATVGASALAGCPVASLSDGQRQRVLIARALAQEPAVLLLDEPTSFLDPAGRIAIMALLRRLAHDHGTTVLCSTHEVELALAAADRVWLAASGRLRVGEPRSPDTHDAIAAAFAADGVRFDRAQGRFVEAS